jgi:hypothetical protein
MLFMRRIGMQRRLLIALLPLIVVTLLAIPGGLSVQAMGMPASVAGPLALTQTAEPPTLTPVPPPPIDTPVPPNPPTFTPLPQEAGERKQRTAVPTETPVPTEAPTVAVLEPSPTPTATPIPPPAILPRTGEPNGNGSMLLWLGIGILAIALGGSLMRRRQV